MQITDDLVNRITAELMKRLAGGGPETGGNPRPRALVMGPEGSFSPALAGALQATLDFEFKTPEFNNLDDLAPYQAFILTRMSCTGLVQASLGFDEGCAWESRLILAGLLNGAKVFALEEGLAWRSPKPAAPRGLLRYYGECEKTAQSYGLRLIAEADLPRAVQALRWDAASLAEARPQAAAIPDLPGPGKTRGAAGGKKLLAESDAAALCREGVESVTVPAGTIITPLAQDYFKARKVAVLKG